MATLITPKTEVLIEGADGQLTEFVVQTDNRDITAFDLRRAREKWPTASEAAAFWAEFISWNALSRSGVFPGKFEDFHKVCVQVRLLKADGSYAGETSHLDEVAAPLKEGAATGS